MPDLIAQGAEESQRWRRSILPRMPIIVGRAGGWGTPWDKQISRSHAEIVWKHGRLLVRKLPEATNPVFLRGKATEQFYIKPGEHFVIGSTTFTLTDEQVHVNPADSSPVTEQTFSQQALRRMRFRNADQRIEVLSRLPEIISGATSDSELFVRVVSLLLSGMPRAMSVAIVDVQRDDRGEHRVRVLQWDRRVLAGDDFRPSQKLIVRAVETGESVVHLWSNAQRSGESQFTLSEDADWAFCTPLDSTACKGWAIYVTGKFDAAGQLAMGHTTLATPTPSGQSDSHDLHDELKFTEVAAGTLSSLRQLRQLERSQAGLRQFLSPVVLEAVAMSDWEAVLTPRETQVSVLFCDLRGFSRETERHADELMSLLQRVSRALGVTTRHILDQNGVVGDFHGDAVMGFWGWPLEQPDAAARAAMAALAIRSEFEAAADRAGHPLANFRIGLGIATGRAVAGKIGTVDQVTVTVFGPVVNVAARLEGMTKVTRAPILLDEETAQSIRSLVPPTVARVRKLARVRPYGMESSLWISELLPPAAEYPLLSDAHVAVFEQAVEAMFAGNWHAAFELLHRVPADDRVKDFLTVYMAKHDRTPPAAWDRLIVMDQK
jgi:adenylate cyclase